mgnify:CR=1 FL=1
MKKKEEIKLPNWLASQEIGKELKKIGFNKRCFFTVFPKELFGGGICGAATFKAHYCGLQDTNFRLDSMDGTYNMPFWEDIFEWFREKGYESYIKLESHSHFDEGSYYYFEITDSNLCQLDCQGGFDDYKEAREKLVYKLIEVYKQNEQEK